MSNFIIEDLKNSWNKKDNGLIKIIIINVIIFLSIGIIKIFLQIGGLESLYINFLNSLMLPANLRDFIFQPWSIITYFFLHINFSHILWNMLFLYWFGKIIHDNIGNNALISLYILGGIIGGLLYMAIYNIIPYYGNQINQSLMLGASAGVFSVVVSSATLIPNYTFHLLFIGPIRIKYIALFYVASSFFDITGNNSGGEIYAQGRVITIGNATNVTITNSGKIYGTSGGSNADTIYGANNTSNITINNNSGGEIKNVSVNSGGFVKDVQPKTEETAK